MLQRMQFRDFVWPKNPETLKVVTARELKTLNVPFELPLLQDFGRKKRVITGQGEFVGTQYMEWYGKLETLFAAGESGVLILPQGEPVVAKPVQLTYEAARREELVRYQFTFWEERESVPETAVHKAFVTVKETGESLWSIANRVRTTVERLVACNQQLAWCSYLTAGERVYLP